MSDDHFRRVNELFDAALNLSADRRDAFLAEACGDDQALYEDVRALLDADLASQALLDGVAAETLDLPTTQLEPGDTVGPYRIVRKLGAGGMGDVYLAERADGHFEQQVALKLIKRGMDSDEIVRRFTSERQILAQLGHPNIAQLLDGGAAADGRPYYAMEYVEGEPITDYCDRLRLSVDQRLQLFMKVCDAVRYAQERLVIHRDLKPANILVTDSGQAKLLDFGIAKVLSPDPGDTPADPLTRTGMRIMTPAYASPEQVRGERITTAADVYSLGVVLYELLSGRRPIRVEGLTPHELEQAIASTDPSKPSTEIGTAIQEPGKPSGSTTPEEIGRLRNTDIVHLRKRLSGDLDNICLMALRKEPERRYANVGQLLEDIERHLNGRTVRARPDTVGYRLAKFWQRHKVAVGAAVAVVFVTIGLVAYYTMRLADERDRAQQEAEKAKAVSEFLAGLFELADPTETHGEEITAREMVDRGADKVRKELASQPETQAEMFLVIANVYRNLGLYDEARPLIDEALKIRLTLWGERSVEVTEAYSRLSDILYWQGEFDSSGALIERNIALKRQILSPQDPELALELNNLGWLKSETGDLAAAESLHTEALAIRRAAYKGDHQDIAESISNLASVAYSAGNYEKAEAGYREALEMRIRLFGEVHPEVATSLNNLGLALEGLDRLEEAQECYERNMELCRQLYGESHQLADAYSFRGRVYGKLDLYHRAEEDYRKAVELRRSGLGDNHYLVGYDLKNLGNALESQKRYAASDSAYEAALAIYRKVFPDGNAYTAGALSGKGRTMVYLGNPAGAESILREALAIREGAYNEDHWILQYSRSHLAWCLTRLGRYDEAEPMLIKAYARMVEVLGDDDYRTQMVAGRLAELYERWSKPDLASHYNNLAGTKR